jgi:competence protein ComGC
MSPMPPVPATKTSGAAIASMVLGILSLFCSIFTAIPALICGAVALVKINKSRGQLAGQGQAIAGLVLGGFGMMIMPILAAMVIPAFSVARGKAQEVQCMNNVKQISIAWEMFELETGKPPRSLADLEKTSPRITTLKCPLARDGETSYEIVAAESASAADPGAVVRVRETEPRHRDRRATAFADGRVEMKSEP